MKKTFALVLAIAMVMSLAAVSFAATEKGLVLSTTPLKYEGDKAVAAKYMDSGAIFEYGKAVYFQLFEDDGTTPVKDYAAVEKLKIKAKWEIGADLVESLAIVKKNVGGEYYYYVEVKVAAKETTADADIVGTLTLNRKKSTEKVGADEIEYVQIKDADVDVSVNIFYKNTWQNAASVVAKEISDDVTLKWGTDYALKFEADDEIEISFGTEPNEGSFTVDVSGQGKVFFKYDTKANEAIAAANPGAIMNFLNFNNPKFNRTGEFMYEMENGAYAYAIVDGKLAAIPGCEYDESDEAFYFYARTLGSYVFSDVELVDAVAAAPVVEAPAVENPTTGAAA